MLQDLQNKKGLVQNVFDRVYNKYDLMNDFMSLGIHRTWKKDLIRLMNPSKGKKLIDVACGTGDIAKFFLDRIGTDEEVLCVDPNAKMIKIGQTKLKKFANVKWLVSSAENLKVESNFFNYYTISFGLRNTKNLNKALSEAYRVLKPGGKFLCLEFSKIENSSFDFFYKKYSKLIPLIGKLVVGEKEPYEYLIKSIEKFINQEELIDLLKKNKFENCSYRNLNNGLVAIHSAWKL